jgi:DNA-binding MarR family transcriptional regulator
MILATSPENSQQIMKLFTALKKMREHQRTTLPFLKSIIDFDIVIEVGYAEEEGNPLTLKQLLLLKLSSRTTVRRKLARLIEQGVIKTRKNARDGRSSHLLISPGSQKLFGKYNSAMASTFSVFATA